MTLRESLEQQIADATVQIALWNAALIADAPNPQPGENVDGEVVDVVAWRKGLMDNIEAARRGILETQIQINKMFPYWVPTRQVW